MKGRPGKDTIRPSTGNASWRPTLCAVPVRNSAVKVQSGAKETVNLTVRARKQRWLIPPLSWILRPKTTRILRLDRLGTSIWNLCDGAQTVEQVVERFADKFMLSFHEARVSVTQYMKTLVQLGALAIVMDTQTSRERHSK